MRSFVRLLKDSKGATAIEYCLIAVFIAVAAIGGISTLGGKVSSSFNNVSSVL